MICEVGLTLVLGMSNGKDIQVLTQFIRVQFIYLNCYS